MGMQVYDGGTQLHHNGSTQLSSGSSQLRRGETTLDNGYNLMIVGIWNLTIMGIQFKNSLYVP
jgi:X-X-X-Leu-X-X-Gly heptad repeat protein